LCALDAVSFEVKEGEIFGIAGPNGSGKTTLFNVISGALAPSAGEVFFNGSNITGMKPHEVCHRGLARTFQIPVVFSSMTVRDNIKIGACFGSRGREDEEKNINEVISFVGLQGKENTITKNLDLFGKKSVMIGAALATRPRLLLLDEPIAGLTPVEVEKSVDLFHKINSDLGITIIIIEHLMKVFVKICGRCMILDYGEGIYLGSAKEIHKDKAVCESYLGDGYNA